MHCWQLLWCLIQPSGSGRRSTPPGGAGPAAFSPQSPSVATTPWLGKGVPRRAAKAENCPPGKPILTPTSGRGTEHSTPQSLFWLWDLGGQPPTSSTPSDIPVPAFLNPEGEILT